MIRKHFRLNQEAFGVRLGKSKSYISAMETDHEPLSIAVIDGLYESFAGLNISWLLSGAGEMLSDQNLPAEVGEVREPERVYRSAKGGEALLDAVKSLVEGYEQQIKDLKSRVERLETRVDYISKEGV